MSSLSFFGFWAGAYAGVTHPPKTQKRRNDMQYENTRIYVRCVELLAITRTSLAKFPSGHAYLADQLRRSSSSTLLNFAEGYGKQSPKDARRYFRIARGSANETAAAFDVALTFDLLSPTTRNQASEICDHLARMLTRFRR